MIRSFKDRATEDVFNGISSKKWGNIQKVAKRKLDILNAAATLEDLRVPPKNRLKKLHGDHEGQHSIRINKQYRICFRWRSGYAEDVEITDYH